MFECRSIYQKVYVSLCAGDFVVVEPIREGHKVQGEITRILYPLQVKTLKEQGLW